MYEEGMFTRYNVSVVKTLFFMSFLELWYTLSILYWINVAYDSIKTTGGSNASGHTRRVFRSA